MCMSYSRKVRQTQFLKGMHGFKQGLSLFSCRCKLQEHRLFHVLSLSRWMKFVSRYMGTRPLPRNKERLLPPRLQRAGLPQAEEL